MDAASADASIRAWFTVALGVVDPNAAVRRAVETLPALRDGPPPTVLAVGKAAGAMAAGLIAACPRGVLNGVVITKDRRTVGPMPASFDIFEGGHPIPDERSLRATRVALAMVRRSSPDEPVVVLLSGGGSALLEALVDGVSLEELAKLTGDMLRAGATINELNAVRSRVSRVKQGGLLRDILDPRPVTLILSDVIGNDVSVIASGPMTPPVAPRLDALAVLDRLDLRSTVAPSILAALAGEPGAGQRIQDRGTRLIIADNDTAVDALASVAGRSAAVEVVWRQRVGEARELAVAWVDACQRADHATAVLVGGGEATVTVRGGGIGGRNTEFAVAAALELERRGSNDWLIASLATDGDDGPTGAAGGIVGGDTAAAARLAGVDPTAALETNATLSVLEATGGVVVTGPTGTNVNDLYVAVRVR